MGEFGCRILELCTEQEVLVPLLVFAVLTPARPFHLGRRGKAARPNGQKRPSGPPGFGSWRTAVPRDFHGGASPCKYQD
jgi:hypothetical protein